MTVGAAEDAAPGGGLRRDLREPWRNAHVRCSTQDWGTCSFGGLGDDLLLRGGACPDKIANAILAQSLAPSKGELKERK